MGMPCFMGSVGGMLAGSTEPHYSGTSDKGPSEIGTRDTCFDPMLIL